MTPLARARRWTASLAPALVLAWAGAVSAQNAPPPADGQAVGQAVDAHAQAIEAVGQRPPAQSLQALETGHFVPGLFTGAARAALLSTLTELRAVIAGAGMIDLQARDGAFVLGFRGARSADVVFTLEDAPPHRMRTFTVDLQPDVAARPPAPPLRWEALADTFAQAGQDGFSGVVLALRGGQTVLQQGYGRVGPAQDAAPTVDTVFDIGSMPIDFTRAAILGLAQDGRLTLDDPVGRFFSAAPADKAAITLGQLMDGSSGLPNFHHTAADADKDLTLIDRATALQRLFAQPLLFAPGSGRSHSHSAFGLLAAVVEQVSGQAYGEHLRARLFGPAGMARTGFYGETLGLPDSAFAVGAGRPASSPNIPPRWGPVSWLVMGSGGMVSSVADMRRAYDHISGHWLTGPWLQRYQAQRVGIGGSERGFLFLRVTAGDGSAVFLASHSHRGPQDSERLVQGLIGMVLPDRIPGR